MIRFFAPLNLLLAAPALAQTVGPAPAPAANPYLSDETRAEAEAKAATVFDAMDADHDGFITVEELSAFMLAHRPPAKGGELPPVEPAAKAMIADADTDHDGRVSAAESKAAADRGFDEADTNHDGVVTPAERAKAMADQPDLVKGKAADSPR